MKKKIINFTTFILLFLIPSCKLTSKYEYKTQPTYAQLAYKIMNNTAQELKDEKKLALIGIGGQLMYNVKKLNIEFTSDQYIDIEEGRKLIIYCAQKFLHNINSNQEIRPYLHSFPFGCKDIDIALYFNDKDLIKKNTLSTISLFYGKISYDVSDDEEVLKTIHKESYEEGLKIIKKEQNKNTCDSQ